MSPKQDLERAGLGLSELVSVSGGDFASAFRARTSEDGSVFVKTHPSPPADFFATEAEGLLMMRSTQTVRVPEVLGHSDSSPAYLMLEWVEPGARPTDDYEFGRSLARMHSVHQAQFGRPDSATTGSLALANTPNDKWCDFFWSCRLEPLLRIASDRGSLDAPTIANASKLQSRLDQLVPHEPASLVHGDLWAGNRIVDSEGRSWLVDPAAHHNHREWDLAMMALFGGFGPEVFSAYHETFPLQDSFNERVPLFQLPPLIVHAIKFGGSYASAVEQALAQIDQI